MLCIFPSYGGQLNNLARDIVGAVECGLGEEHVQAPLGLHQRVAGDLVDELLML